MRLARWLAPTLSAVIASSAGCTLPPNVDSPNCKMTVSGVEPSKQGWVYCSVDSVDDNLSRFIVRDGTGNSVMVIAPGPGSFECGKPNLEIELEYDGAVDIAGCSPAASCGAVSGSCTIDITQFSAGPKQAFSASITAFAAAAPSSSVGYNFKLDGSFTATSN